MKGAGTDAEKKKAALDEQVAEKKADQARAQKAVAEATEELDKAKEKLASLKSG